MVILTSLLSWFGINRPFRLSEVFMLPLFMPFWGSLYLLCFSQCYLMLLQYCEVALCKLPPEEVEILGLYLSFMDTQD